MGKVVTFLILVGALVFASRAEARGFRGRGGGRQQPAFSYSFGSSPCGSNGVSCQPVTSWQPVQSAPVADVISLPSDSDFSAMTFQDSRTSFDQLKSLLDGNQSKLMLVGRCFDGTNWVDDSSTSLSFSQGRLNISGNEGEITLRESGWIQFVRRGTWGWERQFLRGDGNGNFQFSQLDSQGKTKRCRFEGIPNRDGEPATLQKAN